MLTVSGPKFFVRAAASGRKAAPPRLKARDVKMAIQHAQLICYGYEDTLPCRVAWDHVEEITRALERQREHERERERERDNELDS
jgi:hypothetical protein